MTMDEITVLPACLGFCKTKTFIVNKADTELLRNDCNS